MNKKIKNAGQMQEPQKVQYYRRQKDNSIDHRMMLNQGQDYIIRNDQRIPRFGFSRSIMEEDEQLLNKNQMNDAF